MISSWQIITPFYDWTVKNEIEHLAYFDDRASLAAIDPDAFQRHVEDTRLELVGDIARDWMLKAQCFAGSPADGPEPGERVL